MMIDNTDGFDQLSTNQVFKYVYFMVMFNLSCGNTSVIELH